MRTCYFDMFSIILLVLVVIVAQAANVSTISDYNKNIVSIEEFNLIDKYINLNQNNHM